MTSAIERLSKAHKLSDRDVQAAFSLALELSNMVEPDWYVKLEKYRANLVSQTLALPAKVRIVVAAAATIYVHCILTWLCFCRYALPNDCATRLDRGPHCRLRSGMARRIWRAAAKQNRDQGLLETAMMIQAWRLKLDLIGVHRKSLKLTISGWLLIRGTEQVLHSGRVFPAPPCSSQIPPA